MDTQSTSSATTSDSSFFNGKNKQVALVGSIVALLVILIGLWWTLSKSSDLQPQASQGPFRTALQQSVAGSDYAPLQNFFVDKVKSGSKDDETKSAIYWITHRYFDNGGNIYEIYDFINANGDIAFLKEAETIYPEVFQKIATTRVANWSADSVLALLAYYEVIDRYGYADIGVWGMAANKYSEFAYNITQTVAREGNKPGENGVSPLQFKAKSIEKALLFTNKAEAFLEENTKASGKIEDLATLSMIPDDLLVGLNQYGSAVQNLKSSGLIYQTKFTPEEMYSFNFNLVSTVVPRLYFFTNFLYATTLVYGGDATSASVALPLSRAVEYARSTDRNLWSGSVSRVINSKTAGETGMYRHSVVKELASLDPNFKAWLTSEGWTEADFR